MYSLIYKMSIWETFNFIDYLNINENEIKNLPKGVSISTMCATCKLNTRLDISNIEKYLQLNSDDILVVKMNKERFRALIAVKNKPKRSKKTEIGTKNLKDFCSTEQKIKQKDISKNHFYNQITIVIRIGHGSYNNLNSVQKINLKLFKNGSVQMSGCKSIYGINTVLNKLIFKLKEIKGVFENDIIVEKKFIETPEQITIIDFKIDMINSNYQVALQIDRAKLAELLLKKKIKSSYEPCIRACVIIKYTPVNNNQEQKEVSIFVFQKGNVIITGARSKNQIDLAYNYINNIILTHKDEIIKKDEDEYGQTIINLYKDISNDINSGIIKI